MGAFDNILGNEESLFKNPLPLDYDYLPKIIPYRESEQRKIAMAIKPILLGRNGRNLFIYGSSGVGKTALCKHMIRILEEETTDEVIIPLYINCWKANTTYKVFSEIALKLGLKFMINKNTSELFKSVKRVLNKNKSVFIFDEIDKAEDHNFLYMILEEIYQKSIIILTNFKQEVDEMDSRIKSRLIPELLEFEPYSAEEIKEILRDRKDHSFADGVWSEELFDKVVDFTWENKDLRRGLFLMREAGNIAEEKAKRKIGEDDVDSAIGKANDFFTKERADLKEELQIILDIIKKERSIRIGDLYRKYLSTGRDMSYKSFKRRIDKLNVGRFISTEKKQDKEGNTTMVSYEKKLTEF